MSQRRVVVLRGTAANPWDLRPWRDLPAGYAVEVLVPANNQYDVGDLAPVRLVPVATAGSSIPVGGRPGALALKAVGERYRGLGSRLRGADVVHAAELGYWFTAQAARLRAELGFRLAVTVWETLPFADAYRNVRTRRYRRRVLEAADLFQATTGRARDALVLEGADPARIHVSEPGVDLERYAPARIAAPSADGRHLLVSTGRLVWEKGHQDLLRAVALLRTRGRDDVRVLLVGVGPEEARLRGVVRDLGLDGMVELRGWVPHEDMPGIYAQASALELGSLPMPFWEEQFGMVLAEAMAAHTPVVASASGAIPEVVGEDGVLVAPGDWVGLADALEVGPLARTPAERVVPSAERLRRFSAAASAERLDALYRALPR